MLFCIVGLQSSLRQTPPYHCPTHILLLPLLLVLFEISAVRLQCSTEGRKLTFVWDVWFEINGLRTPDLTACPWNTFVSVLFTFPALCFDAHTQCFWVEAWLHNFHIFSDCIFTHPSLHLEPLFLVGGNAGKVHSVCQSCAVVGIFFHYGIQMFIVVDKKAFLWND